MFVLHDSVPFKQVSIFFYTPPQKKKNQTIS